MRIIFACLSALAIASCGSSEPQFDLEGAMEKDARMKEIRDSAQAACQCEFQGGTREECRQETEASMAGLDRTPWPTEDEMLIGQGYCFPELDGQCFTYGKFLRTDPDNQFLCSSVDVSDVLLVYQMELEQNGGDKQAAEAAALPKFEEVRAARAARN